MAKKLLSTLLTLLMVVTILPAASKTVQAWSADSYADIVNTTTVVRFDNKDWYLIQDYSNGMRAGTVTLLTKECVGESQFDVVNENQYFSPSAVAKYVGKYYDDNISAEAKAAVDGNGMILLSKEEAQALSTDVLKTSASFGEPGSWWLRSPGEKKWLAAYVTYQGYVISEGMYTTAKEGVRPVLRLDLSKVTFSYVKLTGAENTTASGGRTTQAFFNLASEQNAITDVVYTANDGYYFPEDYSVPTVNGISVTRNSYRQITVSGTPNDTFTEIKITPPTAKTKPDAPNEKEVTATNCTAEATYDGTISGVTSEMEWTWSEIIEWKTGTGEVITERIPGTYYVRYKATDTSFASDNLELHITGYGSYLIVFNVVNGSWDKKQGEDAKKPISMFLVGKQGESKLSPEHIPAVGNKPNEHYKAGSWDVTPNTETVITKDTTYTYTYVQKETITPTVSIEGWTYGEKANSPSVTGNSGNGEVTYTYAVKGSEDYSTTVPVNTGDYTIKATIAETANYFGSEATADFTISPVDKTALQNAISKATTYYNSISTDYSDVASALQTVITQAKAVKDDDDKTQAEIVAAFAALTDALTQAQNTVIVIEEINDLPESTAVTPENKTAIDQAYTDLSALSDSAKANVPQALKDKLDACKAVADLLQAKADAKQALDELQNSKTESDYDTADWEALIQAITDGKDTIDTATSIEAVNTAKQNAIDDLSAIQTLLEKAKDAAKKDLDDFMKDKSQDDYYEDDWETLTNVIADAKTKIDKATSLNDVNTIRSYALTAAEIVKTKVAKAIETINALPEAKDVTTSDKEQIEKARAAYDDLDDAQKAQAGEKLKKKLTDAEEALAAAEKEEADTAAANAVTNLINNLPDQITLNDEEKIREAESAYNGLTEDQKKKITAETLEKLNNAKNTLADLKAVKAVEDKIDALKTPEEITVSDEADIKDARKAYEDLTPVQKEKVTKLNKLEEAESALQIAEVVKKINNLPSSEDVKVSDIQETAIEEAKKAYDALSASQKDKIDLTLTEKLFDSEEAIWNLISYSIIEGEDSNWMKGNANDTLFVFKRNMNDKSKTYTLFDGVSVDGDVLTENTDYTAQAGSVKINLKPSYLNTLSIGKHELAVHFDDDHTVTTTFRIIPRPTPVTPDYVPPRTGIE